MIIHANCLLVKKGQKMFILDIPAYFGIGSSTMTFVFTSNKGLINYSYKLTDINFIVETKDKNIVKKMQDSFTK